MPVGSGLINKEHGPKKMYYSAYRTPPDIFILAQCSPWCHSWVDLSWYIHVHLASITRIISVCIHYKIKQLLQSAVGKTHDLWSDLWWTIPLRILLGQFWDTSWIPPDQVSPGQTHRCPGACGSRQKGHVVILDYMPIKIGAFHILPTGLHGLCFGFCFAGPLPLRSLLHGPLSRVHFGESLVVRLHSEIDHIHLSSEAQCVSHHLPQVDCHNFPSL